MPRPERKTKRGSPRRTIRILALLRSSYEPAYIRSLFLLRCSFHLRWSLSRCGTDTEVSSRPWSRHSARPPAGSPCPGFPPKLYVSYLRRVGARTDHSPSVSYLPSDRGLQAAYRQLCSRVSSAWRFALPTVLASSVETECEVDPTLPSLSRIVCTYMYVRPGPLARPLCLCYMYDTMTQVLSLGGRPRGDRYGATDTFRSTFSADRSHREEYM